MPLMMEQYHATVTLMSETHLVVYESRHCSQDFSKRPQLAYELYIHGTFSFANILFQLRMKSHKKVKKVPHCST